MQLLLRYQAKIRTTDNGATRCCDSTKGSAENDYVHVNAGRKMADLETESKMTDNCHIPDK